MQTLQYKKDTSPTIATWSWPKLFRTPHEISNQKTITSTSEAQELQSTRPKTTSPKGKLRNQGTLRLGMKNHLRMVSWHLKTSSFQRWLDDWVPRDGGLVMINPIGAPYVAHNIAPLIINPLINPYRNCLFLPFLTFEKHTASNTHHGRVALVSWLAPCHLWRGVQAQSRAGNGGDRAFPRGLLGRWGWE